MAFIVKKKIKVGAIPRLLVGYFHVMLEASCLLQARRWI